MYAYSGKVHYLRVWGGGGAGKIMGGGQLFCIGVKGGGVKHFEEVFRGGSIKFHRIDIKKTI